MHRSALADLAGLTAAAISQYERGEARPTNTSLAQIALALGLPVEFFRLGRPIDRVPIEAAHFRSLRATPASSREQALAFSEIVLAVIDLLEQYVELPKLVDVVNPVEPDCRQEEVAERARHARDLLGVAPGPVPHVVRLLEASGIVVVRMPPDLDPRVDAFSTDVGRHPLVLLSPLKDDRARSRFDAAHELGHLVLHHAVEPGSKVVEQQANQFASEFLAPSPELLNELPRRVDWERLLEAKVKWGMSLAALVYRAHAAGLWGDHTYRRANEHLRAHGYPEQGPLGPPESPSMLGMAMDLLHDVGTDADELARVSRIPAAQICEVIAAGRQVRPRIRLNVDPFD